MKKKTVKVILIILSAAIVVYLLSNRIMLRTGGDKNTTHKYLALFTEVSALIRNHYVEKVDPETKFPEAFTTLFANLDESSAYLDTASTFGYLTYSKGEACGLGILGRKGGEYFTVTGVIPDSPADSADIEPGDSIQTLNGKSLYGLSYWGMYLQLLSPEPKLFELTLKKEAGGDPKIISLESARIKSPWDAGQVLPGIYYFPLMTMDKNTVTQLRRLLQNFDNCAWIFDLRYYLGGDLDSFIDCTALLLPRQILLIKKKGGVETVNIGSMQPSGVKAVYLIDSSTMLFSELLAHVLKINGARLIGQESRGFVSHLKQFFLDDGSSVLLKAGHFELKAGQPLPSVVKPDVILDTRDRNVLLKHCVKAMDGA